MSGAKRARRSAEGGAAASGGGASSASADAAGAAARDPMASRGALPDPLSVDLAALTDAVDLREDADHVLLVNTVTLRYGNVPGSSHAWLHRVSFERSTLTGGDFDAIISALSESLYQIVPEVLKQDGAPARWSVFDIAAATWDAVTDTRARNVTAPQLVAAKKRARGGVPRDFLINSSAARRVATTWEKNSLEWTMLCAHALFVTVEPYNIVQKSKRVKFDVTASSVSLK